VSSSDPLEWFDRQPAGFPLTESYFTTDLKQRMTLRPQSTPAGCGLVSHRVAERDNPPPAALLAELKAVTAVATP